MATENEYTKPLRRTVSRRRTIQGAAIAGAGLAAAALIGCRAEEQSTPSATGGQSVSQPKRGGTISYAGGVVASWDTRGTTLDPHINSPLGVVGFRLFYQALLAYDF